MAIRKTPTTITVPAIKAQVFDKAVAELKQGVETATAAGAAASAKALKTAKDVVAFNQGSVAAITQSGQILAAGTQDLLNQIAKSSQASMSDSFAGFRAWVAAKTPKERLDLQMGFFRASTMRALAESGRFTQAGIALATKAAAPLTARAILAAQTIGAAKG